MPHGLSHFCIALFPHSICCSFEGQFTPCKLEISRNWSLWTLVWWSRIRGLKSMFGHHFCRN